MSQNPQNDKLSWKTSLLAKTLCSRSTSEVFVPAHDFREFLPCQKLCVLANLSKSAFELLLVFVLQPLSLSFLPWAASLLTVVQTGERDCHTWIKGRLQESNGSTMFFSEGPDSFFSQLQLIKLMLNFQHICSMFTNPISLWCHAARHKTDFETAQYNQRQKWTIAIWNELICNEPPTSSKQLHGCQVILDGCLGSQEIND